MKVIPLYNEKALIRKALMANKAAQQGLYKNYAPKMLALCRRYVKDLQYAEDMLLRGFLKVFLRLETFKGEGSFEGWIRCIMVRECLSFLKNNRPIVLDENLRSFELCIKPVASMNNDADYLLKLIDDLPEGCRLVFMLHALEGYKHAEISETLKIPLNTSKTKLFQARKILQKKLKIYREKYEAL